MAKVVVDFTDADSGGRIRIPEDDYRARVESVTQKTAKSGNEMLVWTFVITEGKHKGKKLTGYASLSKEAAWKLKSILEAMGISVPSKKVALNTNKYIGEEVGVTVGDDEFNGRISSKIMDYVTTDVLDSDEVGVEDEEEVEIEEAPKKKGKKGKKGKKAAAEEEDVEEIDLDEI